MEWGKERMCVAKKKKKGARCAKHLGTQKMLTRVSHKLLRET